MTKPEKPKSAIPKNMRTSTKNIGNQLRKLYDDVANEPVPDDFLKLLEEADAKTDIDNEKQP